MLCTLMLFAAAACGDGEQNPVPGENPYDLLGIGNIHIGMWVTPPKEFRTQEAYDTMAESGINFVNGFEYFESASARRSPLPRRAALNFWWLTVR